MYKKKITPLNYINDNLKTRNNLYKVIYYSTCSYQN